jgi:glycosyltransferase involved in cell wall biosynthesis
MAMLITVVLPVYNGQPYLEKAISSVLAQDVDLELIISDNCSSDGTLEVAEGFADSRIRILRNDQNIGIFGNLNRCISAARGDPIQVFCHDDVMLPGYLASQAALLAKHPDAGLVYGMPQRIDEQGRFLGTYEHDLTPERIEWPLYLWISSHYGNLPASGSSVMIPRRTFDAVGLFDPVYPLAGDLEFYNRVAERFPILRNKDVKHSIRTHQLMTSALPTSGAQYLREELMLADWYRRHWSEPELRTVRHFRAHMRGRFHLGWIRRLVMRGNITQAALALRDLNRLYPLRWVIGLHLQQLLGARGVERPSIPPPMSTVIE